MKKRFDIKVKPADGSTPSKSARSLLDNEIALCAARAGVQVLSKDDHGRRQDLC